MLLGGPHQSSDESRGYLEGPQVLVETQARLFLVKVEKNGAKVYLNQF